MQLNPPKISIVTPSYNQGEFLEACIDSILSQNYPNLEYVIMDGGSTDNSVNIIKKYEKYLTYWQSKPDGGQYQAIHDGFKKTTGEIMAWLNSDDKYHHHAFYKVAYLFNRHPGVEWLTGRTTLWDKNGRLNYIFYEFLPTFHRKKMLQNECWYPSIQQESTFWRRSLWDKAGGRLDTDLTYAGDLELWIRFFRYAQLITVDTLLGGYRKHGNQKVELFLERYMEEAKQLLDAENMLVKKGQFAEILPQAEPLSIDHDELKAFIDDTYMVTRHAIYKISDDADFITDFLVQEYVKHKGTSNFEASLNAVVLHLFRKLHIYGFYSRHEAAFSRVYQFARRCFVGSTRKVNNP
jgi:glycosyltransferase involved in cell wall biosynthesis